MFQSGNGSFCKESVNVQFDRDKEKTAQLKFNTNSLFGVASQKIFYRYNKNIWNVRRKSIQFFKNSEFLFSSAFQILTAQFGEFAGFVHPFFRYNSSYEISRCHVKSRIPTFYPFGCDSCAVNVSKLVFRSLFDHDFVAVGHGKINRREWSGNVEWYFVVFC